MSIRWMLDTNACIAVMNGRPAKVKDQLRKKSIETVGLSVISLYELQYGVYKFEQPVRNQKTLDAFCTFVQAYAWDEECADAAGRVRADLEKSGRLIGPYDMQIAAHAVTTGASLVTVNVREFKRVKNPKIVNWSS